MKMKRALNGALRGDAPDDIPPPLFKFWHRRHVLFAKYDKGIRLDTESWYSVTPERVAAHVARKCALEDAVVLDAFCGCGGNTIQFAKRFRQVVAVDIDPVKIAHAKHNAAIYGVAHKIEFICGDFMGLAGTLRADVVFLSPPWGGPGYTRHAVYDLDAMVPLGGFAVFDRARLISPNICYYVPKNVANEQVDELAVSRGIGAVEIEENFYDSLLSSRTLYFGELCGRDGRKGRRQRQRPPPITSHPHCPHCPHCPHAQET